MSKLNLKTPNRCDWVPLSKPIYLEYHDNEWGKPIKNDHELFELMVLEMFQAGLNWYIILKKRKAFKIAFDNFNPKKVAVFDQKKINQLLNNSMIIRNRLKIKSSINNANKFIKIQPKSFSVFIFFHQNFMLTRFEINNF